MAIPELPPYVPPIDPNATEPIPTALPPVILSFDVSSDNVEDGDMVAFVPVFEGGIGIISGLGGCFSMTPVMAKLFLSEGPQLREFTLTVTNIANQQVTATVSVGVRRRVTTGDHTHVIADTLSLQAALDTKANTDAVLAAFSSLVDAAPTGLNTLGKIATALANETLSIGALNTALAGKAASVHGHAIADVTGLQTALGDGIDAAINALIGAAPDALDTLQELAAALGNDANYSTTITNLLATINSNIATINSQISGGAGGIIGDMVLLRTDVAAVKFDIIGLESNKAAHSEVTVKADKTYVDAQILTREASNHLAGKVVDTTGRIENTIPVFDVTSQTYLHKTIAAVQGGLDAAVAQLQTDMGAKANATYVDAQDAKKANTVHPHVLADITNYVSPDVNKAYVDAGLGAKVDSTAINGQLSTLLAAINAKPSALDISDAVATKAPLVHTHQATDIIGLTLQTPARWNYVSANQNVASGQAVDIAIAIPALRLYGVSVAISGLTTGQTAKLDIYGNALKTEKQYSAGFTDVMPIDSSQAWMFRNTDGALILQFRLSNTCGSTISNINVSIVAEPF